MGSTIVISTRRNVAFRSAGIRGKKMSMTVGAPTLPYHLTTVSPYHLASNVTDSHHVSPALDAQKKKQKAGMQQ